MMRRSYAIMVMIAIAFLSLFDFLFVRIQMGPLTITALRVILLGLFLTLLVKQIRAKKMLISNSTYINCVLLFFIIWILYGVLQLTWATDKISAVKQVYYLCLFFTLVYVMLVTIDSMDIFVRLNQFIYGIGVWLIIFGIIELNFGIHFPTSRIVIEPEIYHNVKRATAVFYNENDFSFYLVLISPMFLLNTFYKKGLCSKLLNILFFVMICYIVMANDSKFCMIALVVQIGALLFRRDIIKKAKYPFILLGGGCTLLITFQWSYLQSAYELIKYQLSIGSGSTAIRKELLFKGLELLKNSYFLGVGPGNFEENIHKITSGRGIDGIFNAHNWWMELLANYGLIVFLSYVIIFVFLLLHLKKIRKWGSGTYSYYALYFFLSFIGFIFASASSSSIFYMWYQWLHFSLAVSFINIYYMSTQTMTLSTRLYSL
ncbi:hypothetical protein B1690_15250 [Geobacillus sp. 46C-IIa]|uniref:O-antigen ligase family protein n=1 Tax=Geobacillus sp. 46C-IIa TaxID=1963025 RepID=UPI0009BD90BC|nr:O-antigen ligase family protein [Geobacillus sp. 46C-IIa]OQP04629.1 hypothetical protein B1690_15250 [Geobacillus sp. 46C-IIa]